MDGGRSPAQLDRRGAVAAWYAAKTHAILARYGPGPRVHFHAGVVEGRARAADPSTLRRQIRASQARLLAVAAAEWGAGARLSGHVLDAGCGLGGGAIFWAEHLGARVTAVTDVPLHAAVVTRFARQTPARRQIEVVVADACGVRGIPPVDAVVAVESSCYFPRGRWFAHLRGLLRPGGVVCVADAFIDDPKRAAAFDTHWKTRVGSTAEYDAAAASAGFDLLHARDLSAQTREFWELTLALIGDAPEREASRLHHRHLLRHWGGPIRYHLRSYVIR